MVNKQEPLSSRCCEALDIFNEIRHQELNKYFCTFSAEPYLEAAELIWECQRHNGRIHTTGIGKPAHICGYAASLLSSTGTPTYFLHGTEAVHGSCGQIVTGDVVICISNSGETSELKATVCAIKNNGGKILGITGNPNSWLAQNSDVHLFAGVSSEGDVLNRAPRASVLAETLVLQRLSIVLQTGYGLTPAQYIKWHPGGMLGRLRKDEE